MFYLILLVFFVTLLILAAMSIGVIMGRGAIKGSCGGIQNEDGFCQTCGKKPETCDDGDDKVKDNEGDVKMYTPSKNASGKSL